MKFSFGKWYRRKSKPITPFQKFYGNGFGNERTRGVGTGDRVIHTTERPAWDAKSRCPLPDEIFIGKDKAWSAYHKALTEATNGKYQKGE